MIEALNAAGQGLFQAAWWGNIVWPVIWALLKIVVLVLPLLIAVPVIMGVAIWALPKQEK